MLACLIATNASESQSHSSSNNPSLAAQMLLVTGTTDSPRLPLKQAATQQCTK